MASIPYIAFASNYLAEHFGGKINIVNNTIYIENITPPIKHSSINNKHIFNKHFNIFLFLLFFFFVTVISSFVLLTFPLFFFNIFS